MIQKPTDAELIAAGWKSPPSPPPPLADLLWELREAELEAGPGCWTVFSPDADDVLRTALKHQPELHLRRKVTKRDGEMWGIATLSNEELMLEIILKDVEHPALRKMLERVIREGDFQRACILKEMHAGPRAATTPAG